MCACVEHYNPSMKPLVVDGLSFSSGWFAESGTCDSCARMIDIFLGEPTNIHPTLEINMDMGDHYYDQETNDQMKAYAIQLATS